MYELIAEGNDAAIPGTIIRTSRLGGWQCNDPSRSTMLNVYCPQTVDMAGSHLMNSAGGQAFILDMHA